MQFKSVPAPPPASVGAIDGLATARDALPIVPRSEDDCCGRLVDRVEWIDTRDAATTWIGFLRALDLAERNAAGHTRVRDGIDREDVRLRFRRQILGAEAAIDALASEPRSPDAVFEASLEVVPEWERRRSDAWRDAWLDRTEHLLEWAALLGFAERVQDEGDRADGTGRFDVAYVRSTAD